MVAVKQIKAINMAHGRIQVRLEEDKYSDRLTIEVKDNHRYLKAETYRRGEVRNLYYFIKPVVVRYLENEEQFYKVIIEENKKALAHAEARGALTVWVKDREYYRGERDLTVAEVKAKIQEQEKKLAEIQAELKTLKGSG